jgi:hypothetical protein
MDPGPYSLGDGSLGDGYQGGGSQVGSDGYSTLPVLSGVRGVVEQSA